jgi:hypothetical protein
MAAKISLGGNFNTAGSWAVVDATSLLDSEAGNTALTTSYVNSAQFTPGAITIDGIAVKLASRAASPTGTVTINLRNVTDSLDVKTVALNVSDLPACTAVGNDGGWLFFKFNSSTLLIAGKSYYVQAKTSSATQVNLFRDATAGNWSRMLRTTTTGAPGAGDQLDIMGEHTGAGTGNDITITMDQIATSIVDLGSGTDAGVAITVCKRGTINFAYSAATNYYLKCSGNVIVYNGGTFTIGTVANPIPTGSTAVLEFDPVADGGMGLITRAGSTFTAQGAARTAGKNIFEGLLKVDTVNGEGHFHLDSDSGWKSGDVVAIASTTQTYSQSETKILNGDAGAEICNVTVNFGASVHSGTSPTQGEVILLTRNVMIRSATSTIMSYCDFKDSTTVNIDWVEFYYLGENTAGKFGVCPDVLTGSINIQYCSLHDMEDGGFFTNVNAVSHITFNYNGMYNCNNSGATQASLGLYGASAGTDITVNYNVLILCRAGSSNAVVYIGSTQLFCTFTYNTIAGSNGVGYQLCLDTATAQITGNISYNTIHSGSTYGMKVSGQGTNYKVSTISYFTIWRNTTAGLLLSDPSSLYLGIQNLIIDNFLLFGNSTNNILVICSFIDGVTIQNSVLRSDPSFTTTNGFSINLTTQYPNLYIKFLNTTFGVTNNHTNDINVCASVFQKIILKNCLLASGTEVTNNGSLNSQSGVYSSKHDQSAGGHKTWLRYGIIQSDTTYYNTASPSERLTPNTANIKLESGSKKVAVASGATVTISCYVRKSTVASGGALYNGNQPRLILKENNAIGIATDTVIETQHVEGATANWELLTGTTAAATDDGVMEFLVDCDGTAGFVNVDDWTTT